MTSPIRILAFLAWLVPLSVVAQAPPAVSPEPFFKHNDYGGLRLSPSGK